MEGFDRLVREKPDAPGFLDPDVLVDIRRGKYKGFEPRGGRPHTQSAGIVREERVCTRSAGADDDRWRTGDCKHVALAAIIKKCLPAAEAGIPEQFVYGGNEPVNFCIDNDTVEIADKAFKPGFPALHDSLRGKDFQVFFLGKDSIKPGSSGYIHGDQL